jgi:oligogalacturonide transporter
VLLVVIFTWERPYTEAEKQVQSAPLDLKTALLIPVVMFRDLFSTLRIRAFRQHLSIYLGGYISQDIFNTAFPIFVVTVMMGATLIISQLLTIMYVAQLISVMIAINIVIRTGPVIAYRIAISFFGTGLLLFLAFYYLRPAAFAADLGALEGNMLSALNPASATFSPVLIFWLFVPILLAGLGRGTLNFVPWSVYNYLPDVDEAVTGQRREGIFAGVMTLVRKLAQSAAIICTGWIIDLGGYVSPKGGPAEAVQQTPQAIATITWLLILGPILVMLAGLIASWRFRLNAQTHDVLMAEIDHLRAGGQTPTSPEARAIVEDLSGWKYEQLWGKNPVSGSR